MSRNSRALRRASARQVIGKVGDGKGGLLGRLAGAVEGGSVRKGSMGANEGSTRFQEMMKSRNDLNPYEGTM